MITEGSWRGLSSSLSPSNQVLDGDVLWLDRLMHKAGLVEIAECLEELQADVRRYFRPGFSSFCSFLVENTA